MLSVIKAKGNGGHWIQRKGGNTFGPAVPPLFGRISAGGYIGELGLPHGIKQTWEKIPAPTFEAKKANRYNYPSLNKQCISNYTDRLTAPDCLLFARFLYNRKRGCP